MSKHIELLNGKFGIFLIDIRKSNKLFICVSLHNQKNAHGILFETDLFGIALTFGYIK